MSLEKVTVPRIVEIDPHTGFITLVIERCVIDMDTGNLHGEPSPVRVPIEPGQDYDSYMAMVNTAIARDFKEAPVTDEHLELVKKFVTFAHDKETVKKYRDLKKELEKRDPIEVIEQGNTRQLNRLKLV